MQNFQHPSVVVTSGFQPDISHLLCCFFLLIMKGACAENALGRWETEKRKEKESPLRARKVLSRYVSMYLTTWILHVAFLMQQLAAFLGYWPLRTLEGEELEGKTKKEERGG